MSRVIGTQMGFHFAAALSFCLLVAAGCSKSDQNATGDASAASSASAGGAGGPGSMRGPGGSGGMGGRNAPVAANATGEQIYAQKCGCHGPNGKGGKAPVIAGGAGESDSALVSVIHDGKGRMPSFAMQLSDDQIKKVVATIKSFQ